MKTRTRTREHGTVDTIAGNGGDRIEAVRAVVKSKQYAKLDGCMVDLYTASVVCQVYDALNSDNKAKLASLPWPKMAALALRLVA